jgi:hypothetical protein
MVGRGLSLGIGAKVFDCALEIYPMGFGRFGKKIRTHQISDFTKKLRNLAGFYLFAKFMDSRQINPQLTIKHISPNPQRQISLKHQRPSFPDQNSAKLFFGKIKKFCSF